MRSLASRLSSSSHATAARKAARFFPEGSSTGFTRSISPCLESSFIWSKSRRYLIRSVNSRSDHFHCWKFLFYGFLSQHSRIFAVRNNGHQPVPCRKKVSPDAGAIVYTVLVDSLSEEPSVRFSWRLLWTDNLNFSIPVYNAPDSSLESLLSPPA